MNRHPLVSVCIPCYNGAEFLSQTLQSVLDQTLKDFEVIVADNHSTDRSVEVAASLADPRIKILHGSSNIGMARNCARAMATASGKYVKLLCADDLLHPECLMRQTHILEETEGRGVVLTVCARSIIDQSGRTVLNGSLPLSPGVIGRAALIRKCIRWGTNLVGEPAVGLFRRSCVAAFDQCELSNSYLLDLNFWAEILREGEAFVDDRRMAAFRISRSAVSSKLGLRQAECFRRFARKIKAEPGSSVSSLDLLSGYLLSFQWCLARNVIVRYRAWDSLGKRRREDLVPEPSNLAPLGAARFTNLI